MNSLIDLEGIIETVKIAALPKSTALMLEFPLIYIVAPAMIEPIGPHLDIALLEDDSDVVPMRGEALRLSVHRLETVPAWAFDAWVGHVSAGGILFDYVQAMKTLNVDRHRWSVEEKWRMLNALAENDIKLPLYGSKEQALAALKMEVRCGQ